MKAWLVLMVGLGVVGASERPAAAEAVPTMSETRADFVADHPGWTGPVSAQAVGDTLGLPDGFPDSFPILAAGGRIAGVMEVPTDILEGRIQGTYTIVSVALDRELREAHGIYREALKAAGWEIDEAVTHDGSRPGIPTVAFTGPGYVGDIRFETVTGFLLATIHMRTEEAVPPERWAVRR
ncbi:MAG: hypothetical protein EA422_07990 [Gemmatimonadales bacterium]|nr:MAG: hypothetical protein EA422_07990 [Gemmatimonadales bacterium]